MRSIPGRQRRGIDEHKKCRGAKLIPWNFFFQRDDPAQRALGCNRCAQLLRRPSHRCRARYGIAIIYRDEESRCGRSSHATCQAHRRRRTRHLQKLSALHCNSFADLLKQASRGLRSRFLVGQSLRHDRRSRSLSSRCDRRGTAPELCRMQGSGRGAREYKPSWRIVLVSARNLQLLGKGSDGLRR